MISKYKIFLLFAVITLVSCDDFLTVVPDSSYSVAGSYQTQTDFEQAIAGVYAAHQSMYSGNTNSTLYLWMMRADEVNVWGQVFTSYIQGIERFIDEANNATHAATYASYYRIISRCNVILDKIDGVPFADENLKKYIKGEALAFRAYSYWMLGWEFGGVPLIKKVTSVEETKTIARSTQQETFDFAAEDFTSSIALLPSVKWTGKNIGRITKYAAMGIQARMYMFQKDYAKAKPLLSAIISSGLYNMEPNYKNCFTESKENGDERVWEVQFMGGQLGEGQWFTTGLLPDSDVNPLYQPFSGYTSCPIVSQDMVSAYEVGDLRKDISCATNIKWNGVVDTQNYFVIKYHYADVNAPKVKTDWGVNLPVLRYTDVKMMYAEVLNEEAYSSTGEAFTIINQVRARAGLSPLTPGTVPDKESFRNALMKERRIEFAFEGLRWMDIIRTGTAVAVMNAKLSNPLQDGGTYRMKEHQILFPIPFDELNRYQDTKILWQNPGY